MTYSECTSDKLAYIIKRLAGFTWVINSLLSVAITQRPSLSAIW